MKVLVLALFILYSCEVVSCDDYQYNLDCIDDLDCSMYFRGKVVESNCMNRTCRCYDTFIKKDVPCIFQFDKVKSKFGDSCINGCGMPYAVCDYSQYKCACQDGYISSADANFCLKDGNHGKTCKNSYHCYDGAEENSMECSGGLCVCREQFQKLHFNCIKTNQINNAVPSCDVIFYVKASFLLILLLVILLLIILAIVCFSLYKARNLPKGKHHGAFILSQV